MVKLLAQCDLHNWKCYDCRDEGYAVIDVNDNDVLRKIRKPESSYLPIDQYWNFENASIDYVTFRHLILKKNNGLGDSYWVLKFHFRLCKDINQSDYYPMITKYRYDELYQIWEKYDRDIAMLKDANLALTTENLHELIKDL